jgi:hypothetical protein
MRREEKRREYKRREEKRREKRERDRERERERERKREREREIFNMSEIFKGIPKCFFGQVFFWRPGAPRPKHHTFS